MWGQLSGILPAQGQDSTTYEDEEQVQAALAESQKLKRINTFITVSSAGMLSKKLYWVNRFMLQFVKPGTFRQLACHLGDLFTVINFDAWLMNLLEKRHFI